MVPATPTAATAWTGIPAVSAKGVRMMPMGVNVTDWWGTADPPGGPGV